MASYFTTSIAPGQWFYVTDANPNATITATIGSIALRIDAGNVSIYLNTTGSNVWSQVTGTSATGTVDWTAVSQVLMADNSATALAFGSTGLLNLLQFVTTNGAERITYNGVLPLLIASGGLQVSAGTVAFPATSVNLALSAIVGADLTVASPFILRMEVPAGAPISATLPARAGGWRVIDAWIVSGGAAAGTIQVSNPGAPGNVTNAMGVGAAGVITRTTACTNATFAGGSTITATSAASPAASCYISLLPL